ncbi:hypothetical protein [Pseudomonas pharyngis]|uniref:hypothetical protein n=1 Tax=Pseudomonas pharyngis TaxID=2892333 RepID=UPI001F197C35|nr:hypothetical protein [Pseudomonas pharyngis]
MSEKDKPLDVLDKALKALSTEKGFDSVLALHLIDEVLSLDDSEFQNETDLSIFNELKSSAPQLANLASGWADFSLTRDRIATLRSRRAFRSDH